MATVLPIPEHLQAQVKLGNLFHAYIFSGLDTVQIQETAFEFARHILGNKQLDLHPDFILVDGLETNVSDLREIVARLSRTSLVGGKKVCVITHADSLSDICQNLLLKTLEEPKGNTVIVLLGSEQGFLSTIRSRAQVISFGVGENLVSDQEELQLIAALVNFDRLDALQQYKHLEQLSALEIPRIKVILYQAIAEVSKTLITHNQGSEHVRKLYDIYQSLGEGRNMKLVLFKIL